MPEAKRRIELIPGATSGLGAETARQTAHADFAGPLAAVDLATSAAPTPTAKFLQREGELPW
jgi:hypothetical protein